MSWMIKVSVGESNLIRTLLYYSHESAEENGSKDSRIINDNWILCWKIVESAITVCLSYYKPTS